MNISNRFCEQMFPLARNGLFPWMATLVVLLAMSSAASGAVVDSGGFENPFYITGDLEGQQGWQEVFSGPGSGNGTAVVQTFVKESGNQAVAATRAPNVDNRWAISVIPFVPLPQRIIQIDWDMYVTEADSNFSWGPFMGVEAYDDDTSTSGIGLLGSLGVDASTTDVLYQIEDTGALTETGFTVDYEQWYHFQIRLNFDTDNYAAFFDGDLVASTGFVDRGFGLDSFTDADISVLAANSDGDSQAAVATAYFDNFEVNSVNAADFDGDGDVDGADFLAWQRGYGIAAGTALPADGDANGDLNVDGLDLAIWRAQFGFVTSSTIVATSAPEPTSFALFVLGGLLALGSGRRRSKN